MRRMPLNPHTRDYLLRMHEQYEADKLLAGEAKQLFQDLYDTGIYRELGTETIKMVSDLLRLKMITPKPSPREFQ